MQVTATALGYYGVLRQPGDTFDVPDTEEPSSWFAPEGGWPTKGKGRKSATPAAEATAADGQAGDAGLV